MSDFLCGLTGRIVLPFEPEYQEDRQGFNRAIQQYPLIIVYCENKSDVSNAVIWAIKHQIPIRIRSGGHNYEGYSNGNCTIVIDISSLNRMIIDENSNTLYAEGGVTNEQVYQFVGTKGYPFPGGTCPTVGVSGYALGGGWGLSCRYFGLGCDSLLEIEMVSAAGEVLKANECLNPDLYWAVRGAGGGNYGIIVAMKFGLPSKVDQVTLIEIDYLRVSEREQESFLFLWQKWLKGADRRTTLISRIYNSKADGLAMLVRGIFYGRPEEAKKIMADFLALKGAMYRFSYVSFLEAVTIIGSAYPPYERFQSVSRFVTQDFNCIEIPQITALIRKRPKGSVFTGLSMYALGGKVSEVGQDDTAFFYRRANYIIWLETIWEEKKYAQDNRQWIKRQFPTLAMFTRGSYVNFPYRGLPNYLKEYYGTHVDRLEMIKRRYDPCNVFSYPQGLMEEGNEKPCSLEEKQSLSFLKQRGGKPVKTVPEQSTYRGFRYVIKGEDGQEIGGCKKSKQHKDWNKDWK